MTTFQTKHRIHPLVAVAAVSVTLMSALGIAAITGVLPNSHGFTSDAQHAPTEIVSDAKSPQPIVPPAALKHRTSTQHTGNYAQQERNGQVASNGYAPSPAPIAKPAPHNSAVGIGVGAVIGGVLGNQVGSGNGKTLATIAGAIGGGYLGNEVAKKNQ
ncbi:MAG: glycine zipper 2TM domain-containing protein [Rhodoferax sp.]